MTVGLAPQVTVIAGFACDGVSGGRGTCCRCPPRPSGVDAVLFALVWADCGGALTITRRAAPLRPQPIAPLRLIQYQVALIYFSSGVSKFAGARGATDRCLLCTFQQRSAAMAPRCDATGPAGSDRSCHLRNAGL
jgi:hypothetical protein